MKREPRGISGRTRGGKERAQHVGGSFLARAMRSVGRRRLWKRGIRFVLVIKFSERNLKHYLNLEWSI